MMMITHDEFYTAVVLLFPSSNADNTRRHWSRDNNTTVLRGNCFIRHLNSTKNKLFPLLKIIPRAKTSASTPSFLFLIFNFAELCEKVKEALSCGDKLWVCWSSIPRDRQKWWSASPSVPSLDTPTRSASKRVNGRRMATRIRAIFGF